MKRPVEKIYYKKLFDTYKYGYPSFSFVEDGTLLQNYVGYLCNEVEPFNLFFAHKCNPLKAWHRFFLFSMQFSYTLFIDAFLSETEIPDTAARTVLQFLLTSLIMDPLTFFMKSIATLEMCEKAISDSKEKSGRDELEDEDESENGKKTKGVYGMASLMLCFMHCCGDSIFFLVSIGFLALVLGLAVGVKIVNQDPVWIDTYFRVVFLNLGVAWLKKIVTELPNWYVEDWEEIPIFSSLVNRIPFCKLGLKSLGLYQETYAQSKERFMERYPGAINITNTGGKLPNFDVVYDRLKQKCIQGNREKEKEKEKEKVEVTEPASDGPTAEQIKWEQGLLQKEFRHAIQTVVNDPSTGYRRLTWVSTAASDNNNKKKSIVDFSALSILPSWSDPSTPLQDQESTFSDWLAQRTTRDTTSSSASEIRLLLIGKSYRQNQLVGVQVRQLVVPPGICRSPSSLQEFLAEYGEKPLDASLAAELAEDIVQLQSLSAAATERAVEEALAVAVAQDDHMAADAIKLEIDHEHWEDSSSVDETPAASVDVGADK